MFEEIIANSYKNFHAKGLNYICLSRTPLATVKLYFFEGEVLTAPELVIPHNHRYNFITEVLAGTLRDKEYKEIEEAHLGLALRKAQKWKYMTPLNGGNGFTWESETNLWWYAEKEMTKGQSLYSPAHKIHTITIQPDTVLLLTQLRDIVPLDAPTHSYSFTSKETKPNTSGLYEKFTEDELKTYLDKYEELVGKVC
jgi:hypothetical protein